jgi:hypothetical protein
LKLEGASHGCTQRCRRWSCPSPAWWTWISLPQSRSHSPPRIKKIMKSVLKKHHFEANGTIPEGNVKKYLQTVKA